MNRKIYLQSFVLKERTNHISSCARKEKKKRFAYCKRRQRGREAHKGVMFQLEDIFQFC